MEYVLLAGTALKGAGQISQGRAVQEASEEEAGQIRSSAKFNEELRRKRVRKLIGRQLAQASEGGFTRSAQEVITQTAVDSDLQGQIDSFNAETGARRLENFGSNATQTGVIQGLGSFATGAFGASELGVFDKFKDIRRSTRTAGRPLPFPI